jgi:hypothetical protein
MPGVTLPTSVVEVIAATGSPSAGLRKFKQLRGLIPVAKVYDLALGDVRKREQLGQFCAVFAPQIQAAKQEFAAKQATVSQPKATSKEASVTALERLSKAQLIELIQNGAEAEVEATRKPKASKPKATRSTKSKAKTASAEPNVFTAKVVAKFNLPTKSGATFTWNGKTRSTKWVVVSKRRDGAILAVAA